MNRLVRITILVFFVILASILVRAHKDSPESLQSTSAYKVSLSLIPTQIVEKQEQLIFIKVEDIEQNTPLSGLRIDFIIHKTNHPENSENLTALESTHGRYFIKHTFKTKGNYMVMAKLYKDEGLITEISRNIHVEPNGPSIYFWLYMLIAIIISVYLASKSHEI